MSLRRSLGYAALGVAAAVGAARSLRRRAGDLDPALDGEQHTVRWRGMDVEYTTLGDESNPPLICFHGINAAASSAEFREVAPALAEEYRVVAVDLPGFGRSDRPPIQYDSDLYEAFVAAFLDDFDSPAVVASGLTGAYVVAACRDDPSLASGLTLICPTTTAGPDPARPGIERVLRAPVVGSVLFALLASKPSLRHFNRDHAYYHPASLDEEWVEYEWRTTHQRGARYAPAAQISGGLNADIDLGAALADLSSLTPTLVWGREATVTPLADGRAMAERADCRLVVLDDAMLLPHVEYPDAVVETIRNDRPDA